MAKYYVGFEEIKHLDCKDFKVLMAVLNMIAYEFSDLEKPYLPIPRRDIAEFLSLEEFDDGEIDQSIADLEELGIFDLEWYEEEVICKIKHDDLFIRKNRDRFFKKKLATKK